MSEFCFDRNWHLGDLLDATVIAKIGSSLSDLLGSDAAIVDSNGQVLWGQLVASAPRQMLVLEQEAIGFVSSASASTGVLQGISSLLLALLRAQIRFKTAATMHLESVVDEFESLKNEHARLLESESRYKKLAEDLEERVKEQVSDYEDRRLMLYQTEKLASVGQLAAGMAHEINNPLSFIRSNLSSFRSYLDTFAQLKERLDEGVHAWNELDIDFIINDSHELLADSDEGLARIARIISDLKDFSNVDQASTEFVDLNVCLQQVASIVQKQLSPTISLKLELGPLPNLLCLPGHMKQLFFNLIHNGIQAIEEAARPGQVTIITYASENGIEIHIADNGVGMTPAVRLRAFEPFFTTRQVGAGTGLGLATARNIVLAHSGRIDLVSRAGVGTTVTLFFPTTT